MEDLIDYLRDKGLPQNEIEEAMELVRDYADDVIANYKLEQFRSHCF